jgi:crotonobetainyl-CoA:carnitine CoA-transferase CaiB-like acyl-CoA transferase
MGPLSDIRVVELGFAVAGPIAATLLADFGADVVKVEQPGQGDGLRNMGPKAKGVGVWWLVAGRNKKSITLDLKKEGGKEILRKLLQGADVLVENFRPGVMEKLGFDWETLHAVNPRLVMLRISGFGQTGPYSRRPGFGKLAEAYGGATNLTGHMNEPPLHPSYSLGDVVCALMGAYGVMLALHGRQASGKGQVVDLALYEPLFRLIEWQIPLHSVTKTHIVRNGPRFPFAEAFVTELCQTKDGDYIVVSAATVSHLERLSSLLRNEGMTGDFSKTSEVADALRVWIKQNVRDRVLEVFAQRDLVSGLVYTPAEMLNDEHMLARENIVTLNHTELGGIPMPNVVPKLGDTPGNVRWLGPTLGQHTDEILREWLNYDNSHIEQLRRDKIV